MHFDSSLKINLINIYDLPQVDNYYPIIIMQLFSI